MSRRIEQPVPSHAANPHYAAREAAFRELRPLSRRPVYAKLPKAPLNESPVPELTSLYHKVERGPYGDSGYPGNCSGNLIRDLLRYFRPTSVYDPLTGSGTCRDVCRELGIECWSNDLHQGFDACVAPPFVGHFDFCWLHPPYWRQKIYTDDPRDLSRSATLEDFLGRYESLLANAAASLAPGGRLAILMGDYFDREAGFLPLVYHTKHIAFRLGLRQCCTDIIRFSHGASSGRKVYRSAFIPALHDVVAIFVKHPAGTGSINRLTFDRKG